MAAASGANDGSRAAAIAAGSVEPAGIRGVEPNVSACPVFATAVYSLDLSGDWENPFDPSDIDVWADVSTPSGASLRVRGFYFEDFDRRTKGEHEILDATGEAGWRVRFTPVEVGEHRLMFRMNDGSGEVGFAGEDVVLRATQSSQPGFVRISAENDLAFAHDDGSMFFPTGINCGWPGVGGTYVYDRVLADVAANGGNTVRVWLAPSFHQLCLESHPEHTSWGLRGGLGWMNQDAAWRFDHVVRAAEAHGIKILPVLFSFSGWRDSAFPRNWHESPYNAANGGPLEVPGDVFTDEATREFMHRRIRYAVARWGHSPAIMGWELWNEVNGVDGYDREASAAWHAEAAALIRSIDPYGHPISTSTWWPEGDPLLDGLEGIDWVMTHEYNAPDHARVHRSQASAKTERYGKPHFTGEFGNQEFDHADSGSYAPERTSVHNVLWANLLGGSAGGGLYWYWEIGEKDRWPELFAPIVAFASDLDLHRVRYEAARVTTMRSSRHGDSERVLRIFGAPGSWNDAEINRPHRVTIDSTGYVDREMLVPGVLHGVGPHAEKRNPVTFVADFPEGGEFAVLVKGVSGWGGSGLEVLVDGAVVLREDFPDPDTAVGDTITAFNGRYAVAVPPGRRELTVRASGHDWIDVSYEVLGVLDAAAAPVWSNARVRSDPGVDDVAGFAWFRHEDFNWIGVREGRRRPILRGLSATLRGLPDGPYEVHWIGTQTGERIQTSDVTSVGSIVDLQLPPLTDSVAAKIYRR